MTGKPIRGRHAAYAGWVCGLALRAGLNVVPEVTEDGHYTDRLRVLLPAPEVEPGTTVELHLVVPKPPDDWAWPP